MMMESKSGLGWPGEEWREDWLVSPALRRLGGAARHATVPVL